MERWPLMGIFPPGHPMTPDRRSVESLANWLLTQIGWTNGFCDLCNQREWKNNTSFQLTTIEHPLLRRDQPIDWAFDRTSYSRQSRAFPDSIQWPLSDAMGRWRWQMCSRCISLGHPVEERNWNEANDTDQDNPNEIHPRKSAATMAVTRSWTSVSNESMEVDKRKERSQRTARWSTCSNDLNQ